MGLQVDLGHMLGLSNRITCPKCKNVFTGHLNDYDLESPSLNTAPGVWAIMYYCPKCDHEWVTRYKVELKET